MVPRERFGMRPGAARADKPGGDPPIEVEWPHRDR